MVTIYALTCSADGSAYIGCTAAKLSKRMREHRCLLRANRHAEQGLQSAWNAHGEQAFSMIALELLADDSVQSKRDAELRWMRHYEAAGRLYNRNRASFAPTPDAIRKGQPRATAAVGRKWTPEANEKRAAAQRGKPKGHGAKISATKKALGQRPTLEAARKGGIAATRKRYAQD